jgi:hypothetical protein
MVEQAAVAVAAVVVVPAAASAVPAGQTEVVPFGRAAGEVPFTVAMVTLKGHWHAPCGFRYNEI